MCVCVCVCVYECTYFVGAIFLFHKKHIILHVKHIIKNYLRSIYDQIHASVDAFKTTVV